MVTKSQRSMPKNWESEVRRSELQKSMLNLLGVMKIFIILILMRALLSVGNIKAYHIVHPKYTEFILCH